MTSKIKVFIFAMFLLINLTTETLKKKKKNLKKDKKSKKHFLNDPVLLENSGYKSPIIVESLSMGNFPDYYSSEPLVPDTINSGDVYYDGKNNLNVMIIECNSITSSNKCMANALCGWCGNSNSCVPGTPKGPLTKCTGKFAFNKDDSFNSFNAGNINLSVNSKNGPAYIKTETPDLSGIVLNPLMH